MTLGAGIALAALFVSAFGCLAFIVWLILRDA